MATSVIAAAAALVAIHVGPDMPAEFSAVAVRSCEVALGARQCLPDGPDAVVARWQATVTPLDDPKDGVRIDLRQDAASPALMTRELAFLFEDAPRERWASIGVLIAALVVARSREEEEASARPRPGASQASRPGEPTPQAPEVPVRTLGPWRLDLQALLSRRLERGSPEVGARFRASILPAGGPWFGLLSIAAASRASTEPSVSWFSMSVGPGVRLGRASSLLAAEFSAGGVAEYWRIGASESGRSEQAGEFRVGGFGAAEALLAVHRRWILSLGAEGRVVAPRLRVEVSGRAIERVPELGWLMFAGLRFIP